jgi:hypothetical protein
VGAIGEFRVGKRDDCQRTPRSKRDRAGWNLNTAEASREHSTLPHGQRRVPRDRVELETHLQSPQTAQHVPVRRLRENFEGLRLEGEFRNPKSDPFA